jgi:hypothetical protein
VPVDGYYRIQMLNLKNNKVQVTNTATFSNECFIIRSGTEAGLECQAGMNLDDVQHVDIKVTRAVFGERGTEKDSQIQLKVGGLTNPRIVNEFSFFKVYSLDQERRIIDQNFENQQFFVKMTKLRPISSISIDMLNKTNGAETIYTISMIPSTEINSGDIVQVQFPAELNLPFELKCEPLSAYVENMSCTLLADNVVQFKLTKVNEQLFKTRLFETGAELVL